MGGRSSEEVRFPVPTGRGSRCSEERRLPCPGGVGCPMPRGAPGSLSRWSLARGAPRGAVCWTPARPCARCSEERRLPCPGGRGSLPTQAGLQTGEMGGRATEEMWFPVSGGLGGRASEEVWFPVPVRPCARRSEECRLPCPGGVGCPRLRRAPSSLSRWGGVPGLRGDPVPCPGEAVRATLRRVPFAVPRVEWGAAPPKRCGSLPR
jgi:hypothetical protein